MSNSSVLQRDYDELRRKIALLKRFGPSLNQNSNKTAVAQDSDAKTAETDNSASSSRARLAFNTIDLDSSGQIDAAEFGKFCASIGMAQTPDEVKKLIAEVQKFGTGNDDKINFEQFNQWWVKQEAAQVSNVVLAKIMSRIHLRFFQRQASDLAQSIKRSRSTVTTTTNTTVSSDGFSHNMVLSNVNVETGDFDSKTAHTITLNYVPPAKPATAAMVNDAKFGSVVTVRLGVDPNNSDTTTLEKIQNTLGPLVEQSGTGEVEVKKEGNEFVLVYRFTEQDPLTEPLDDGVDLASMVQKFKVNFQLNETLKDVLVAGKKPVECLRTKLTGELSMERELVTAILENSRSFNLFILGFAGLNSNLLLGSVKGVLDSLVQSSRKQAEKMCARRGVSIEDAPQYVVNPFHPLYQDYSGMVQGMAEQAVPQIVKFFLEVISEPKIATDLLYDVCTGVNNATVEFAHGSKFELDFGGFLNWDNVGVRELVSKQLLEKTFEDVQAQQAGAAE